mgnify:CR=1 FL=1
MRLVQLLREWGRRLLAPIAAVGVALAALALLWRARHNERRVGRMGDALQEQLDQQRDEADRDIGEHTRALRRRRAKAQAHLEAGRAARARGEQRIDQLRSDGHATVADLVARWNRADR